MSSDLLRDALVDLGWSLFTELGVPGTIRNHATVVIDPEPVVVSVGCLLDLDPRLRDQVFGWCATHAGRLSFSRLQGLARALPVVNRASFERLAATLRERHGVRWPDGGAAPWDWAPEVKPRDLPIDRPALARFRVRALCGVGARADALTALLARAGTWTRASDLSDLGYSKRAVAAILSELADAGLVEVLAAGNARTYQLAHARDLEAVVGAADLAFPNGWTVMSLVLALDALRGLEGAGEASRRVEAHKQGERLRTLSTALALAAPPATRGNPDAWQDLVAWGTRVAQGLASGESPVFARR